MGRMRKPDTVTDRLHGLIARELIQGNDRVEVASRYRQQYGGPWQRRRLGKMLAARETVHEKVSLVCPSMLFRGMAFVQVTLNLGSMRSARAQVR